MMQDLMYKIKNNKYETLFHQIGIGIQLINGETQDIRIDANFTGKLLRNYIYNYVCDELQPKKMSLFCNGKRIGGNFRIIQLYVYGELIKITQQKIPLAEVEYVAHRSKKNKKTNVHTVFAIMSCSHMFTRQKIIEHLKEQVKSKDKIQCPYKVEKGVLCGKQWTFEQCDNAACLTKTQRAQFSKKLDQNLQKKLVNEKLRIKITTINGVSELVSGPRNVKIQSIKHFIFEQITQTLGIGNMSLYYKGKKLPKSSCLQIPIKESREIIEIIQKKADLEDIIGLDVDINGIDTSSEQKGVAQMTCGHKMGRDTMVFYVQAQIRQQKYQIRCPYCRAIWQFKYCKKVGVFTKEETENFQLGISKNWVKFFTKKCPKCQVFITKANVRSNKTMCPSCSYGPFCYICLNKWRIGSEKFCGSQVCYQSIMLLMSSPLDRQFKLKDRLTQEIMIITTPKQRACPHCLALIEHRQACKHMTCKSCHKDFCWVCLKGPQNGKWPCGSFKDYCGKIAPRQLLIEGHHDLL